MRNDRPSPIRIIQEDIANLERLLKKYQQLAHYLATGEMQGPELIVSEALVQRYGLDYRYRDDDIVHIRRLLGIGKLALAGCQWEERDLKAKKARALVILRADINRVY